ncbi:hypothetical protein PsorP6_003468 [Peronosclerospora sorghi]|uniref:Uncharacterized protein n=1 Tax=Peronosclerospora sorghi TaxID=230839 RepID=A0ACC0VRW4_9STRA|nr:hypothetical protein PsorP6_003468 [Peronosclerospora sorghi]
MNAPPDIPDADASAESTAMIAPVTVVKNVTGASSATDDIDVKEESPTDAHVEPPLFPVDTRPTMAHLLPQQETICRDKADVKDRRSRIGTPNHFHAILNRWSASTPLDANGHLSPLA